MTDLYATKYAGGLGNNSSPERSGIQSLGSAKQTSAAGGRRAALLVLFLCLVFSACGSSSGGSDSTSGADSGSGSLSSAAVSSGSADSADDSSSQAEQSEADVVDSVISTHVNPDGTEVSIEDTSRIVVLNGDLAEVVWALGLGDQVVATDISATYPPEADESEKIGYQRSLSVEGVLSFDPTVIVGNTAAGPPEVIQQLIDTGVPVAILDYESDLGSIAAKVEAVGQVLGVPDKAATLATELQGELDQVLGSSEATGDRGVFLYFRGADTQLIGGAGSGADAIFDAIGMVDAGKEIGLQGIVPLTPESLVEAAPDVIVVTSAGLESLGGIDGLLEVPGIAQTPAAQGRRILAYDDQLLLGFGPRSPGMIGQLASDVSSGLTFDEQWARDGSSESDTDSEVVELSAEQKEVADAFLLLFADFEGDIEARRAVLATPDTGASALDAYTTTAADFGVAFEVADVVLDGDAATVVYTVLLNGTAMASDLKTNLDRSDSGWTVSQAEFCTILSLARTTCP